MEGPHEQKSPSFNTALRVVTAEVVPHPCFKRTLEQTQDYSSAFIKVNFQAAPVAISDFVENSQGIPRRTRLYITDCIQVPERSIFCGSLLYKPMTLHITYT